MLVTTTFGREWNVKGSRMVEAVAIRNEPNYEVQRGNNEGQAPRSSACSINVGLSAMGCVHQLLA